MIVSIGEHIARLYNRFPARNEELDYYSPEALVENKTIDYNKHCKFKFGEYVQAQHTNQPTDIMVERRIDGIYLYPNLNSQGGHVIMNLNTGRIISRGNVVSIPLTEHVKERVENMAIQQGIDQVKFTNKKGYQE